MGCDYIPSLLWLYTILGLTSVARIQGFRPESQAYSNSLACYQHHHTESWGWCGEQILPKEGEYHDERVIRKVIVKDQTRSSFGFAWRRRSKAQRKWHLTECSKLSRCFQVSGVRASGEEGVSGMNSGEGSQKDKEKPDHLEVASVSG